MQYNVTHSFLLYSIIEQTTYRDKRNAAEVFLDEWSTMGRKRPTLRLLLELLTKAELFRAADYVACDILKRKFYVIISIK